MKRNSKRAILTGIFAALLINGVLPYLVYVWLKPHVGSLTALLIAILIPLIENVYVLGKYKRTDVFGILMLSVFALSAALVAFGGDERVILARESAVTFMVGLWFLGSLAARRPLIFYLALRFTTGPHPEEQAAFAAQWQYPYFRRVLRIMTFGWGIVLACEAVVRTVLVYALTTEQFLIASSLVFYPCIGLLIVWTAAYRRRSGAKLQRIRQDTPAS